MQTNPPNPALVALAQAAAPALEGQSKQQNEAPALAESAQSAIETVAFHYPKAAPSISIIFPDQAWFHSDAFYGAIDAFKVCQSRLGLSLITNHYAEGNRFSADVQITPAQARSIAAMLLNAADFAEANPHFGKAAA